MNESFCVHGKVDDIGLSSHEFRIYFYLARCAADLTAWPSTMGMADNCRMSHNTVRDALARLEGLNMIRRAHRKGRSDIYTLTRVSEWLTGDGLTGVVDERGIK